MKVFVINEFICHLKQLCSYNNHRCCSISYFPILKLSQLYKYLVLLKRQIKIRQCNQTTRLLIITSSQKQFCLKFFTLAAGCSTSNIFSIVAPSLVIVTSPMSSTSIQIGVIIKINIFYIIYNNTKFVSTEVQFIII